MQYAPNLNLSVSHYKHVTVGSGSSGIDGGTGTMVTSSLSSGTDSGHVTSAQSQPSHCSRPVSGENDFLILLFYHYIGGYISLNIDIFK